MVDIIEDLKARGMLDSFSDEEGVKELLSTPQTIYCGFDPSARSMQLGNFIMITILRRLQQAGHRIIAIVGGATGMIGDPSGKAQERTFLGAESVLENARCLKAQLSRYLDFSSEDKGVLLDNYDWWSTTNVIEYLRDYGKMIPVNYMLSKDLVRRRLETGISYTEFSYMVLQAGDFYRLRQRYGCSMQIGGGDQWGNLTTALDFVRRKEGPECPCQVFSVKLITDSNGKKFGKSEKGALYLDPEMTAPFDIYQYFINVSDADVLRYLYIFDDRPTAELDAIYARHMEDPGRRLGQRELAYTVTASVHGKEVADRCVQMTEALFSGDFSSLGEEAARELARSLEAPEAEPGIDIVDALVLTGLASSKTEARRFVTGAAVTVAGSRVTDLGFRLTSECSIGGVVFIKRGKKNNAAVILK